MTEENLNKNDRMETENSNSTKNTKRRGYHRNYNKKDNLTQEKQNTNNRFEL